jgi:uncharacterized protein YjbI with pentapeptide repeats
VEVRCRRRFNRNLLNRKRDMISIDVKSKPREAIMMDTSRDLFLRHEHLTRADYSKLKNVSFESLGCIFEDCSFTNMVLRDITFASGKEQSTYVGCRFDGSTFKHIVAGQARFERCSFLNVRINRLFSHAAEFIDCVFSGVLRGGVFYGRVFGNYREYTTRTVNEFHGNDFSGMKFLDVDFRNGVDLSRQKLPAGDDYLYLKDAERKLAALRQKYLQCPPSPVRKAIFEFLESAEEEIRAGQHDLFICKDSQRQMPAEAVEAIWNELGHTD